MSYHNICFHGEIRKIWAPVVQSVVSLTSSLRVILLTVLANLIHNILICFVEKMWATHIFFSKKFQHICISLDVNFNKSLTKDVVSFKQLGPVLFGWKDMPYLKLWHTLTIRYLLNVLGQTGLSKQCTPRSDAIYSSIFLDTSTT